MSLFAFLPFLFADEAPRNVFELQMMSLENHGLTFQYERLVAPPRISVLTALGFRLSGGHDYDVVEMDYGVEGRLWLVGKAPFVTFSDRTMIGPYLGLRFDTGWNNSGQGPRWSEQMRPAGGYVVRHPDGF